MLPAMAARSHLASNHGDAPAQRLASMLMQLGHATDAACSQMSVWAQVSHTVTHALGGKLVTVMHPKLQT